MHRFKGNSKIDIHNIAVADKEGTSEFYCYKENPTDSLLMPATQWRQWVDGKSDALEIKSRITVPTTSIDTFCSINSISEIDILKIDTQGAECLILDGAKNLLSQHAINFLIAEILFVPVYRNQPFFYEVCSKLACYGYSLVNIYNIRYDKDPSLQIKWGDGVFIYRK
jgi:FkbM family methyltransferase